MAGSNPYLQYRNTIEKPTSSFKIVFDPGSKEVTVDPSKIPYGETGLPGSILDIAMAHGIPVDHACGGVAACSTCHVYIKKGGATCNEPEDFEWDMLDSAPANTAESRLACQCVPNGKEDLLIVVPSWNRNLAREGADD